MLVAAACPCSMAGTAFSGSPNRMAMLASDKQPNTVAAGLSVALHAALLVFFFHSLFKDSRGFPAPVRDATWSFVAVLLVACAFNSALFDGLIGDYFCVMLGLLMTLGFCKE